MSDTAKRQPGIALGLTKLFESLGVLNKGSAAVASGESGADAQPNMTIAANTLNATRVGGISAVITSVGGAALGLFAVDRANDDPAVIVAAYSGTAFIVAAALIAIAMMISADVRARAAVTEEESSSDSASPDKAGESAEGPGYSAAWRRAVDSLEASSAAAFAAADRAGRARAWLQSNASVGFTTGIDVPDSFTDEDELLKAGRGRVNELLEELIEDTSARDSVELEIDSLVNRLREVVNGLD